MEFSSSWRRLSWKAFLVFGAIYLQSVIIYVCSVMQSAFYVTHLVDRGLHMIPFLNSISVVWSFA